MEKRGEFGKACFEHESISKKPKSRVIMVVNFFFFLRFIYLFERERAHTHRGRGRGRESSSGLPAEHGAHQGTGSHGPWDCDLSGNQELDA